jgi:hypothetical protein
MKKAKKKQLKTILYVLISLFILSIIGIIYYYSTSFTFLDIQGISEENQNFIWNDINFNLSSIYFGSFTSGVGHDICGDNDGRINIYNDINTDNNLIISSQIGSTYSRCGDNYITGFILLPKGRINATCKLKDNNPYGDGIGSLSSCQIGEDKRQLLVDSNSYNSKTENIIIDLNESTLVKLEVLTYTASNNGLANATLIINFI